MGEATIAMDVKKIVLLVGALLIAAVTAVMAKNMFSGASAPSAQAKQAVPLGPHVLVATRTLPVGTIIDAEAFRFQPWPEGLIQDAYFTRGEGGVDPASLIGTVVRSEITAGQPATQGSLVRPGERGFLAAALAPGMRAITVGVSDTSGVNGFVFPGDRVDLVLTQEVSGGGDGSPLRVSETIIRNIRVLAVDRRMNVRDEAGNQVAQNTSTITFEATPKIAEKIAVAQTIGHSRWRCAASRTQCRAGRAIASGEVQLPENTDPRAERQLLLQIASRPIDTNPTFTVGSDVSRFQRSSVPGRTRENNNDSGGGSPAPRTVLIDRGPGPTVRIARGNNVTLVPVGAR